MNQNIRQNVGREGGMDAARPQLRLRRCLSRTGFSSSTTLGEKNKRPLMGPLIFLAERAGFEPAVNLILSAPYTMSVPLSCQSAGCFRQFECPLSARSGRSNLRQTLSSTGRFRPIAVLQMDRNRTIGWGDHASIRRLGNVKRESAFANGFASFHCIPLLYFYPVSRSKQATSL